MFIGEIILQRRKELKMTQKQLAEKLNVTDRTISRWECGVNLPDVEMLKTVAKVLDVDIKYFYEDVKLNEINEIEEYDYDKIKKYKIYLIPSFILISVSIIMTLIVKFIMLEISSTLGLFSNIHSIIDYAFESGVINKLVTLMILLIVSFIITVISYGLYLKNAIVFKYFYKEKVFQKAYIDVYKKCMISYYILICLSILFILF